MTSAKIAVIDLGTNTFHLLISDSDFNMLYKDKVAVMIGQGGISQGLITEEAIERALKALLGFKQEIERHEVDQVVATGTSAIRSTSNGPMLLDKIEQTTGIRVRVINGDQEAAYIYYGVRKAVDMDPEPALIMDIGGGSVEFIIGNNSTFLWKQSFEIGAQRLYDRFHNHDPIQAEDLDALEAFLDQSLSPLLEAISQYQPKTLIGASGTFDTLSEIYRLEKQQSREPGQTELPIDMAWFKQIHQALIKQDRTARLQIPGMVSMRVDMIVVASSLIKFLFDRYRFSRFRISAYALKEGVLDRFIQSHDL